MKRVEIITDEPYKGITTCRECIGKGKYQNIEFARTRDDVESWLREQDVLPAPDDDEVNGTAAV